MEDWVECKHREERYCHKDHAIIDDAEVCGHCIHRIMEEALDHYNEEAEKAIKWLQELLESKAHVADKVFRLCFLLGDVVEYEGAGVLAKKLFPDDPEIDVYFKNCRRLHRKAFKLRDQFCDRLRPPKKL